MELRSTSDTPKAGPGAGNDPTPTLPPAERLARLRLARTRGIGPVAAGELLARFGSAVAALEALPRLSARAGRPILPADERAARREMEEAGRIGARFIFRGEPAYPASLAELPDAPVALACLGALPPTGRRMVAIVGARNASANGMRFASMLAADLAASGLVVVSGLARGIDAAAHEGAGPGATIAVQAGGADIPYPSENARLHAAIVAGGGCVASERPLGARPMAHHFPQRNRIVSGLCEAVVVVEATQRSGSLITARLGLEQGRDVLAVPGFPLDPRAAGPNSLLRDGAAPVLGAEDVLAALGRHAPATRPPDDVSPTPPEGMEMLPDQDDRARMAMLSALGAAPAPVDEVARRCQLSAPAARMALLELELAGMIRRHPGNQVSLVT